MIAQLAIESFAKDAYLSEIQEFIPANIRGQVDTDDLERVRDYLQSSKIILKQGR